MVYDVRTFGQIYGRTAGQLIKELQMSETTRCKNHDSLKARFTCSTCGVHLCSACGEAHVCEEGQGDA